MYRCVLYKLKRTFTWPVMHRISMNENCRESNRITMVNVRLGRRIQNTMLDAPDTRDIKETPYVN